LSRKALAPTIACIPIRPATTMLNLILDRLSRLLPQADTTEAVHAWTNEDSNWHSSSFELARGLEVIEHRGLPPGLFADTLPAFIPPRA
jgi:hypothetical protein